MKSALVIDCDVNANTLPEYLKPFIQWRFEAGNPVEYLPVGTVFDGPETVTLDRGGKKVQIPQPAFLVMVGQAVPGDDECALACGMTLDQAKVKQREYLAATKGITGGNDMKLFMAGVIDGYDVKNPKHSDATPVYVWGKNAEAYKAALAETKAAADDDEDDEAPPATKPAPAPAPKPPTL